MPPKDLMPRRLISRRNKDANDGVSSVARQTSLMLEHSLSPPLCEDTQENDSESSLSTPENSNASTKKRGRGASKGKSIDKAIVDNRGQLLEIEFPEGFKKPRQFANHLATAIGIVIRHDPDLDCISHWNEIPEDEKLPIYAGLDTWFIIKEWWTNPVVKMYMEEMFQRSYTHWKGRLSASHKRMVEAGEDPRARSPFDWISLQKWRVLCNYYESDKFKKRSATNVNNRKCLPYTHTSGSKSFHTRLLQMENQSYVDNFAKTHMKNGTFVNEKAARKHIEMENLRNESNEDREGLTSEREIVKKVLGQRSGYEKGMGYGFVPSKCTKRSTCESSQLEALKEKLSGTEDELRNAVSCINSQKEMIQNQEAIIQNYDDRCKKQDEEMSSLKEGQNELKKMLLLFMQQNTSSNP